MPQRCAVVVASLFLATLACARAEVPITPATPQLQIVELIDTPTPGAAPATPAPSDTPGAYPAATEAPPSPTSVIQLPPTETPTITETTLATDTAPPTNTRAPATATARAAATSTSALNARTPSPTAPSSGGGPQPIPANATFTQLLAIEYSGGTLFGETLNLIDRRTETWASIRESDGVFVLNLGAAQNVAGVRVYPKKDGNDPVKSAVTLLSVEISLDGGTWTTVLNGTGNCGVPRCDTLTPGQYVDLGFAARRAQYVRLVGGPTRLGLAEVAVAVVP